MWFHGIAFLHSVTKTSWSSTERLYMILHHAVSHVNGACAQLRLSLLPRLLSHLPSPPALIPPSSDIPRFLQNASVPLRFLTVRTTPESQVELKWILPSTCSWLKRNYLLTVNLDFWWSKLFWQHTQSKYRESVTSIQVDRWKANGPST